MFYIKNVDKNNPYLRFNMRSGKCVTQLTGDLKYQAFIPSSLDFKINYDDSLNILLSNANIELGRLDGIAKLMPDVDYFIFMYVGKEATLSSQIEGTQATFSDLLKAEANLETRNDVDEIQNYIKAMNYGLERFNELPLSLRLIRELHLRLLKGVRGEHRAPGEFRKTQNWIGGSSLSNARYIPPPVHEMMNLLYDLENFFHQVSNVPILVKTALIHSQFETIHPFLDGNGRIGRLLITLYLCQQGILKKPLLYLSQFFKKHQTEYYDRLLSIRDKDDIEGWIKFFLDGVRDTAESAVDTITKIIDLKKNDTETIIKNGSRQKSAIALLDHLYRNPVMTIKMVENAIDIKNPNAIQLVSMLEDLEIIVEITGGKRNKVYIYDKYINLF
jgi:Fic family protein